MSLRRRIVLILVGVVICYLILSYAILNSVIYPAFGDLEERVAASNLARANQAILTELESLNATSIDWSSWTRTYEFVEDRNEAYMEENLTILSRMNVQMNAMFFFDRHQKLVWGELINVDSGEQIPLEVLREVWTRSDVLIRHDEPGSLVSGIVQTPVAPLLVASRPILKNDGEGPVNGAFLIGRFLDADKLDVLRERTEVNFSLYPARQDTIPPGTESLLSASAGQVFLTSDGGDLLSYELIDDVYGMPALVVEVHTPREITGLGISTINIALLSHLAAGILFVGVMWLLLQTSIVSPILGLTGHILKLRETGNFAERMPIERNDEIGTLAHQFNAMTEEVVTMRRQLLEQSFKAGMAETAAGVLHNIRNVMTPLVNRVARAIKSINGIRAPKIERALQEAGTVDLSSERRQKLLDYAARALEETNGLRVTALGDLDIALKQTAQVEEILADQEHLTESRAMLEDVPLDEIVREAVSVFPKAEVSDVEIRVDSSVSRYTVRAHRLGLLQVLNSVLMNASESIERTARADGEILLAADEASVEDGQMITLRVRDNGQGIPTNDLIKIFRRKSKVRLDQRRGLGLHWCANTLVRMGGQIRAESDGPSGGAEFQVVLPAA